MLEVSAFAKCTVAGFDKHRWSLTFLLCAFRPAFVSHLLTKHTVCTNAARMRVSAQTLDGDFVMLKRMTADVDTFTLDDVKLGPHDIMASNGVMHLLDDVVLPDSGKRPRPTRDLRPAPSSLALLAFCLPRDPEDSICSTLCRSSACVTAAQVAQPYPLVRPAGEG